MSDTAPIKTDYDNTAVSNSIWQWQLHRLLPPFRLISIMPWLRAILVDVFGANISQQLDSFKASAWGYDSHVKGAYSSIRPGVSGQRGVLAYPLNDKIYFAGEATSVNQFNTAHGAWLSGRAAVSELQGCSER